MAKFCKRKCTQEEAKEKLIESCPYLSIAEEPLSKLHRRKCILPMFGQGKYYDVCAFNTYCPFKDPKEDLLAFLEYIRVMLVGLEINAENKKQKVQLETLRNSIIKKMNVYKEIER